MYDRHNNSKLPFVWDENFVAFSEKIRLVEGVWEKECWRKCLELKVEE
jgi:hypothetical protein